MIPPVNQDPTDRADTPVTVISRSTEDTLSLGRRLAGALRAGTVVALYGELGAGKTVLTRGLAQGLGIREPVTSPTFTVAQEYALSDHRWLYHLDMYRIDSTPAALAFGIDEYLFAPDAITVVEWPERIEELLADEQRALHTTPQRTETLVRIVIQHESTETRRLILPASVCRELESSP